MFCFMLAVSTCSGFKFDPAGATTREMKYLNRQPKNTQNLCVDFNEPFPAGNHVLTLVPVSSDKVAIAYLLLP